MEPVYYHLLQLCFVGLVAYGVAGLVRARRTLFGPPDGLTSLEGVALLSALVAGLVLRFAFTEAVSIHENYANLGRASCAAQAYCHNASATHGWASYAWTNLVLRIGGPHTATLFVVHGVLGGLVLPLLVALLGRALLRNASVAVTAAWLLALLPLHAKLSVSDSLYTLAQVLLVAALLAVVALARTTRLRPLLAVVAGVLVGLTAQSSRVYGLVILLAPAAFLLVARWGRGERPHIGNVHVAALAFGASSFLHWFEVLSAGTWREASAFLPDSLAGLAHNFVANNLAIDPSVTPPLVIGAWLVGAFVLLARLGGVPWRDGALLVGLYVLFALVFQTADPEGANHPTRLRMQVNLEPAVVLLAAAGLAFLARTMAGRLVVVALGALTILYTPAYRDLLGEVLVPAHEQRFLAESLPSLPTPDLLVVADRCMTLPGVEVRGQCVESHFPVHELRAAHGPGVRVVSASWALADPASLRGRRVLLYRGTTFSAWLPEELAELGETAPRVRPAWSALEEAFVLTPALLSSLPSVNPDTVRNHFLVGRIPVGFYWMELRPVR